MDLLLEKINRKIIDGKDQVILRYISIEDPKQMVLNGFLPYLGVINHEEFVFGFSVKNFHETWVKYIEELVNETDDNTLLFWYGWITTKYLKIYENWYYSTIKRHYDDSLKDCNSLPLILYAKEYLFKSMRPKTDMLMFKTPKSLKFLNKDDLESHGYKSIKVTRYANSQSGGLFYSKYEDKNKYFGVFYYYEEESTVQLVYKTSMTFKNKYTAFINLCKSFDLGEIKNYVDNIDKKIWIQIYRILNDDHISCKIIREEILVKEDLMYTPLEIWNFLKDNNIEFPRKYYNKEEYHWSSEYDKIFPENVVEEDIFEEEDYKYYKEKYPEMTHDEIIDEIIHTLSFIDIYPRKIINENFVSTLPQIPKYCGEWFDLYSLEDCFDQPLQYMADKLDIDIIIFNKMVGSHGFVSEILDSRPKSISLESLIFDFEIN